MRIVLLRLLFVFLVQLEAGDHRKRRIAVYTFSDTFPHPGLCALSEAVAELGDGARLRVFGLSRPPGYILVHSHSPTLKFLLLQEALEYDVQRGEVDVEDLMIFVDGHDVFITRPLQEILQSYSQFKDSPYLLSAERNCWPWPHIEAIDGGFGAPLEEGTAEKKPGPGVIDPKKIWRIHDSLYLQASDFCRAAALGSQGRYPFLNIGASIGPIGKVIEVLRRNNRIVQEEDVNDQGAMWLVLFRYAQELNIQVDRNASIFMSMLSYRQGELEREPCEPGWMANRTSPRNVKTGTAPAVMHFNGPSHEDGVWVDCYHEIVKAFRRRGAGHTLFDVDHNMYVSTDEICDYSFFRIRDYHAHPIHEGHLRFMADFRQLPVDPGLLAIRNSSAVDVTRHGTMDSLHKNAPRIHAALYGNKEG
eukprot:gnl/MRDRNA2_/MRDRNA2_82650_c2_seq1.p1 gnl/MRDRNA2_/MRDRNA2_82650_c2~~gnl/MRDRNA2_/MRDRNA2_82650_c2_seq1.p1  ORF type:complete len:418 (-),score=65.76 gnl/MRDRNA2_/MRDRNA2_82650_c2_seq1:62-1315(-)